jgi:predicted MPP superfamily phosphohydrolase
MGFATIRVIVLSLGIFAQVYLFVRSWQIIRSSRRSTRFKTVAGCLAGALISVLFLVNEYLMGRPIPWVDPPWPARAILFYLPAVWGFGSILSALLLCLAQFAGGFGGLTVRLYRGLTGRRPPQSVDLSRRRIVQAGLGGLAAAPFLVSGYGAAYAAKSCEVRELTLPFGVSLQVVQITDIHAGLFMTRKEMRRYVDRVVELQPDLFVLTGDYISNSIEFLPGCVEELARVRARYGTFATLGNHEHWYGGLDGIQAVFRRFDIPLLINAHQRIETERGTLAVAGIDDLRAGHPDLEAALRGLDDTFPRLLLSHRPEIFPKAAAHGIQLTLAGHYHGGQIRLPLPGRVISLAHYWTLYPEGLYRINASHLYVSRGIGTTFSPIRLNAPPEITLLHLTQDENAASVWQDGSSP